MKLLMTTIADENIKDMAKLTHPIMRKFAKAWNADFLVLNRDADCANPMGRIHYRIMGLYDLLDKYNRILNFDSDIVINKDCPDLFEIVPYDEIGVVLEDKGSRQDIRRTRIRQAQQFWGGLNWRERYINTGVFIVSKPHREIFRKINGGYWIQKGFDCVHLSYQIHRLGLRIFELDYKFNHMSMFSEPWNGSPSRFDSYIIHYAGKARFSGKGKRDRLELMRDDINKIYGGESQ